MTPTKEQYELAAKAAGGMLYYDTELVVRFIPPGTPPQFNVLSLPQWLPHEDNAQAFSLLCALKQLVELEEGGQKDIEAAAREAIFLCAVEVGRGMA